MAGCGAKSSALKKRFPEKGAAASVHESRGRRPQHALVAEGKEKVIYSRGEILFLDGSLHQWLGTEKSTLLLWVDDATGAPLRGWFQPQENLHGWFLLCLEIFWRCGLSSCFYLDRTAQCTTTKQEIIHYQRCASMVKQVAPGKSAMINTASAPRPTTGLTA